MNGTWKWILPVIKYNTCGMLCFFNWSIFTYKARTYNNVRATTQFVQMTRNFTCQRLHNIWLMIASLFNTHPGIRRMWYMRFNRNFQLKSWQTQRIKNSNQTLQNDNSNDNIT